MYRRAVEWSPDKASFVEIGCFKGKSTAFLAVEAINSGKDIVIYCVDLWEKKIGDQFIDDRKLVSPMNEFLENMRPVSHVIRPIMGDSTRVCSKFADESLDFVWVDGAHMHKYSSRDIRGFWPKLKNGGWMGGDDIVLKGVVKSVIEFFGPECLPSKDGFQGNWARHQSIEAYDRKSKHARPVTNQWTWWARSKSEEWTPPGMVNR